MVNGSLEDWLHQHLEERHLTLLQRLNIAIDVASALEYLHFNCGRPLVHCDLKPSNILLDDDLVAHVGDFGLATILSDTSSTFSSRGIKGTIGYAAPEYGMVVSCQHKVMYTAMECFYWRYLLERVQQMMF
ncbi:probable LRR receptor-like serine/threonine-protein kinase At3g47570 [Lycium ferocissimum]|uniref:probable LRR receptor-like serine/threonine-protein kinase At3g47570 n=1 Tax=Lycium ferocissimum TaxID=112874 RepID=UPI002815493A|nr:probable LRR receptor-like serine/threonine-protein kinase At3g47570 [Lycium ferocissimum]